ncbi:ParB/RepB/Spo0J family partition protein [Streptomyces phaeochromogenes]|uniref:ParB/RepB/Spo0J family partition protein n=1 Tax=Streptomyces phaeochromogenes TaxID=1923 RepID=A0ABZ1HUR7_STRPH|nr:ParB/RepB/Spo0J family partition protein [Streptomyces phaeochromogenes]WSD11743.1 ParB/RepB/Spo0J family partition protein [Streptomyces phaeochromogenes]WSD21306.1 ParB/RepB/Spo0J family partition protein [Streptomyces phaeochromogenes]
MATATTADQTAEPVPADTDEENLTAVLLDPDTIERDEFNAREHDTEPDADLVNSVKAVGVQDPVSVRPRPDGTYGAFKGWRRSQAAQIANATAEAEGHPKRQIKAYVRADLVGRDAWTQFLSLIENHQRQGMSPKDTLKAAELSLIGMDEVEQKKAARALGVRRGTGRRLGRAQQLDDATLRRASAGGMDLEQIAQLAEVEDVPRAQDRLLKALARDEAQEGGGRGHWDQELALLKAEQDDRTARKEAVAALEKADIPLLPTHLAYGEKDTAHPLSELTTPLGRPLDEDNHKGCPGHSARLDDENQPLWYCADPAEYGHKVRPKPKPPKTAEDEEKAAERARTTACNRAWKAAAGPRKEFVTRLVRGIKALPEDAWRFALGVLLDLPHFYGKWAQRQESEDVAVFLGVKLPESPFERARLSDLVTLSKARTAHVLFAHVAAAFERDMREPKGWNDARMQVRFLWEDPTSQQAAYLLLLEKLGQDDKGSYRLSEVEEQAVAPHRGDDADGESAN